MGEKTCYIQVGKHYSFIQQIFMLDPAQDTWDTSVYQPDECFSPCEAYSLVTTDRPNNGHTV